MTAEAAVQRVASELRDRMRRISDAYLRERLADMEDLANRLLTALTGEEPRAPRAGRGNSFGPSLGPAELLDWHARGIAAVAVEEASPAGHAAILARALGIPAIGSLRGMLDSAEPATTLWSMRMMGNSFCDLKRPCATPIFGRRKPATRKTAELATWRCRAATTADGVELKLMLNVGLSLELPHLNAPAPTASGCSAPRSPCSPGVQWPT